MYPTVVCSKTEAETYRDRVILDKTLELGMLYIIPKLDCTDFLLNNFLDTIINLEIIWFKCDERVEM